VFWAVIIGVTALVNGAAASSLALIGFGLDTMIDGIASATLLWRFRAERDDPARTERVEHLAARVVGVTLLIGATYLVVESIRALASRTGPSSTGVGIGIAMLSLCVLPPFALRKLRLAARLGSRALRGDGLLTAAAATLAIVTLSALTLNSALGWWWTDAAAALLIAAFLGWEGASSLRQSHLAKSSDEGYHHPGPASLYGEIAPRP
jgi:divalent metal cation (Fe/Co/Zn/Cd) transporter